MLKIGVAAEDIGFETVCQGDISGYREETYFVVKDEAEWATVWEKHTAPYVSKTSCPEIAFSDKIVVCALMGERSTAGYDITVEKILVEEGRMHVDIIKSAPSKDVVVAQVITYPYIFVSLERIDAEVIFHVTEENGTSVDYVLPEYPVMAYTIGVLAVLSMLMVVFKRKFMTTF